MSNILRIPMFEIMQKDYISYAMDVAKNRALPDIRDGLKPVHRRILYSMDELGLFNNKEYKKCARVVGDVLGRFHPHGDQSVYDALVILAQDFSTRYPLVQGEGNFGSIDGDGAAAMRYTLCKLSKYGEALLKDIDKNTIDMQDNYDQQDREPSVLSGLIPNLLLNGSFGIAVGMATKIPSHNISDIYNACYYIIDKTINGEDIIEDEIIDIVKAPDFATGGTIIGLSGVKEGYKTGKGKVRVRGKYKIETDKKGRESIVIYEIPYEVNKLKFVNTIKELSKETKTNKGKIIESVFPQIKEVRDESDKSGIRIVLELKKNENAQIVINNLIANTDFQKNYNMNLMCLIDKEPKTVTLLDLLNNFMAHATSVLIRRTVFDLEKSEKRLNIVNGILKCNESEEILNKIIYTIRTEDNPEIKLVKDFGFNEEQANYIMEMKIRALSNLSQKKYSEERDILVANVERYNLILNDNKTLLLTLKNEFKEIEDKFKDERRTDISLDTEIIEEEDLIKEETLVVTYTTEGTIKAVEEKEYTSQKRGGKGVKATKVKDDELIKFMFTCSSKDDLLFFTNEGRCHVLKAYKIGKSTKSVKGRSINNYLKLNLGEKIVSVINADLKDKDNYLFFITKKGHAKKLALDNLSSKMNVTKVISIKDDDNLVQALSVKESDNVLIVTRKGLSLKISMSNDCSKPIRPMGRAASGVCGIKIKENDEVVDTCVVNDNDDVLTITENGIGKRTKSKDWNIANRGGIGVIAHKLNSKTGDIVAVLKTSNSNKEDLFIATKQGLLTRIPISDIRILGRSSVGTKAINLNKNDTVSSISLNLKEDEENINE